MTPYFQRDGITIYHGDCREILPGLPGDASIISDPPYGMRANTNSKRFTGGQDPATRRVLGRDDWPVIHGDGEPFDPSPWLVFPRVVLFGYHHFAERLPVGTVLVWVKRSDDLFGSFLSDAELAWMKGGHGVYCFRKQFPPPSRMAESPTGECAHPTQKPVALMAWCIQRAGVPAGGLVVDPYMGSGATLRAAMDAGHPAIGVELEERYCEIAARRLDQMVLPMGLA